MSTCAHSFSLLLLTETKTAIYYRHKKKERTHDYKEAVSFQAFSALCDELLLPLLAPDGVVIRHKHVYATQEVEELGREGRRYDALVEDAEQWQERLGNGIRIYLRGESASHVDDFLDHASEIRYDVQHSTERDASKRMKGGVQFQSRDPLQIRQGGGGRCRCRCNICAGRCTLSF